MRNPPTVGTRLYLPLHCWRTNRHCLSKLFLRHRLARHLLCGSTLPLRPFHGGRLCYYSRLRALIPLIHRLHPPRHLDQGPFWGYVRRSKPNILPPTLSRPSRHASSILRLPGRLHTLKHCLLIRLARIAYSGYHVLIHCLRGLRS